MQFLDAVEAGDETTMRAMLAGDPALRDRHANLVPQMAEARKWPAVRSLVELGFAVNGITAAGASALHYAAAAGDLSITRLLVKHGADHTARDPQFKAQPAGWAQYFHKPETQRYLESLG